MASDFEHYLNHLFEEHIALSARRSRPLPHRGMEFGDEFAYPMWELYQAYEVTEMIRQGLDPYALNSAKLTEIMSRAASGIRGHNELLEEFGFAAVVDSEYETIARRMRPKHLPKSEREALEHYGFDRVADSASEIVRAARLHAEDDRGRRREEVSPTYDLSQVASRIAAAGETERERGELLDDLAARRSDALRPALNETVSGRTRSPQKRTRRRSRDAGSRAWARSFRVLRCPWLISLLPLAR